MVEVIYGFPAFVIFSNDVFGTKVVLKPLLCCEKSIGTHDAIIGTKLKE